MNKKKMIRLTALVGVATATGVLRRLIKLTQLPPQLSRLLIKPRTRALKVPKRLSMLPRVRSILPRPVLIMPRLTSRVPLTT